MESNKCVVYPNEDATVEVTYGLYSEFNAGRPHYVHKLCAKAAEELWEKSKILVNQGDMHWSNKSLIPKPDITKKFYLRREEEFVYMDCKIRMSTRAMANLLYASLITRSPLVNSYGVGIYEYERKSNSFNMVDIKVHIHPDNIERFEQEATVKLVKPISITVN